jgi:hypothetical protein
MPNKALSNAAATFSLATALTNVSAFGVEPRTTSFVSVKITPSFCGTSVSAAEASRLRAGIGAPCAMKLIPVVEIVTPGTVIAAYESNRRLIPRRSNCDPADAGAERRDHVPRDARGDVCSPSRGRGVCRRDHGALDEVRRDSIVRPLAFHHARGVLRLVDVGARIVRIERAR